MFGLEFDSKLDVGTFLTFITLVAGFTWWFYTTIRDWRLSALDKSYSGALRLLLKILRDQDDPPAISMNILYDKFKSKEMEKERKAYCGTNFKYKDITDFEAAIYRLDWEGKIDFNSANEISFRVDNHRRVSQKFTPIDADIEKLLSLLNETINDTNKAKWDLDDIARTCMRVEPNKTTEILRNALHGDNKEVQIRVAASLHRLLPDEY